MKNAISWVEIPVDDMERAKKFYETIFQWQLTPLLLPNSSMCLFPLDDKMGVGGALCKAEGFYKPSATVGPLVYLNANPDVQQVLDSIEAAGGTILVPKTLISPDHGYMAVFKDTEGNRVALHSVPPLTEHYNWATFTKRITIKSSVENIYLRWATPAGLEEWFLRKADYITTNGTPRLPQELLETGDTFCWQWHGWPDSTQEKGRIFETNGKNFLKFSFGQQGAEGMLCTVKIYTEENETICELMQENIPETEHGKTHFHIGCMTGWLFYLTNLKSILEGGVDLRNKNEKLKNLLNA